MMLRQLPFVSAWGGAEVKAPDRMPLVARYTPLPGIGGSSMQTGQVAQMQAYGEVGWLYSAVSRIAQAVAAAEWQLFSRQANGDRQEVMRHPLLDFWRRPTPFDPGSTFRQQTQQHLDLTGEAWWVLVAQEGGRPVEAQIVRPDRMRVVPDRDRYIAGYVYQLGAERIPLAVEQVIFLRIPSPLDPYRGMGPVGALLYDLGSEKMAAQYTRNFYANSAEPGGVIEYEDTLSDADFERLVARWKTQHQGVNNAHRVAILERGKWVDRKMTMRDSQQEQLRKLNRDIILGAFGMPLSILGITESVNRANAEAAEVTFGRWVIRPRLEIIRDHLNMHLVPFWDGSGNLEFDFVDPTPADREFDLREAVEAKNARILTLNEARARLGEGEMPGGDEIEAPAPPPAFAPPGGQDEDDDETRSARPRRRALAKDENPLHPDPVNKAETEMRQAWEQRFAAEAEALTAHLSQFMRSVRKLETSDLDAYDWDWMTKYGDDVIDELIKIFNLAAAAEFPDLPVPELQRLAAMYARRRGAALLRLDGEVSVVEETRKAVNDLIAEAIEEGDSLRTLARKIAKDTKFSAERARTVARTETATALGQGQKQAARAQGKDEKRWVTQGAEDPRVEAVCLANESQGWIPINALFQSGHETVPAHPNCMCVVGYRTAAFQELSVTVGAQTDDIRCPDCDSRLPISNFRGQADIWCRRCKKAVTVNTLPVEVVDKTIVRDALGNLVGVREEKSVG